MARPKRTANTRAAKAATKTTTKTTTTASAKSGAATKTEATTSTKPSSIVPTIPRQIPLKALSSVANATEKATSCTAKEEVYIQFSGKEISHSDVMNRIHADYKENGAPEEIVSLNAYIKPEDGKVYYVVNDTYTGSIDC